MSGGFILQISDELIQYADGNDLPLFELPGEISADRPLPDTLQQTCAGGKQ